MSHPPPSQTLGATALVLLLLHLTTGCTTQDGPPPAPESASASFSIRAGDVERLSSSGVSALAFSYAEVSRIVIDVKERDSGSVLFGNVDLALSDGVWSGTIPFLPRGRTLTFGARAFSGSGTLLFSGATDQLLSHDREEVPLSLAPANDGQSIALPRIRRISIPTALESGQGGPVVFVVEATPAGTLTYALSVAPGGGAFHPASGPLTLASTVGTFVTQYVPPLVARETDFEHQVKVTNAAGHSVSTTFKTKVKPPGKTDGVADTLFKVLFNPVINSLSAHRVEGTSDILFQAGVSDDSPPETWTYAWSFAPSDGTSPDPLPVFTGPTNPSTLQHYDDSVQGTVMLEVKDANGGTSTLVYLLQPGQLPDDATADSGLLSLSAGEGHSCVLLSGGAVRCWGRDTWGQLGYGKTQPLGDDELPATAGNLRLSEKVEQLAVGGHHTCALLDLGTVRCWGRNSAGQLGYGHTLGVGDDESAFSGGYVNLGGAATRLVAGYAHTCALMKMGAVRCWGLNAQGQLGYGHKRNVGDDELPASAGDLPLDGSVRELVAGAWHTCALLTTGAVRCWGLNAQGQLGYGHTRDIGDDESPASAGTVNVGGSAVQLVTSSTSQHTCARLATGAIRCWGLNAWGQLGYGHTHDIGDDESPASAGVSVAGTVLQVATGAEHTCALLSSGGLKCWGRNESGQLGYGNDTPLSAPPTATVALGATAFQVAAGAGSTCALVTPGETRCWGRNTWGQLGLGHTYNLGDNEAPTAPPNTTPLAPRVVETFQSSAVAEGSGTTFRVRAMDPQGGRLSFSWNASLGTLSSPTTAEETSEVVWTVPGCAMTNATLTATVVNALGLSTSTTFTLSATTGCSNCASILQAQPRAPSGLYKIDPDGAGGNPSFQVYCDMTTDGGGWTLVLAYQHPANGNAPLVPGVFPLNTTSDYAHATAAQIHGLSPTSLRFYCETSLHSRKLHFKTSNPGALAYIRGTSASNSPSYWNSGFTALPGHTAYLPAIAGHTHAVADPYRPTYFPFWAWGAHHWGIGAASRWECDDFPNGPGYRTFHQMWVR